MKAKSIKGKSTEEIRSGLQQSMTDGYSPTLAIAFVSIKLDRTAIRQIFSDMGIALFGATTNGEFIDEVTETGSAAILLLDMKKDHFKIFLEEFQTNNYRETGRRIAHLAKEKFSEVGFLLSISNGSTDGEAVLF